MDYTFKEFIEAKAKEEIENIAKKEFDDFFEKRKTDILNLKNLLQENWGADFKTDTLYTHEHDNEITFSYLEKFKNKVKLSVTYYEPLMRKDNTIAQQAHVYSCIYNGDYAKSTGILVHIANLLDEMNSSGVLKLLRKVPK